MEALTSRLPSVVEFLSSRGNAVMNPTVLYWIISSGIWLNPTTRYSHRDLIVTHPPISMDPSEIWWIEYSWKSIQGQKNSSKQQLFSEITGGHGCFSEKLVNLFSETFVKHIQNASWWLIMVLDALLLEDPIQMLQRNKGHLPKHLIEPI